MGAGASTKPTHQQPDGLYQHNRPRMGAGARSAGRALRVQQQPHPSPGAPVQRLALLCSSAHAAVCCCVTPHTRPTSLPASERCAAALKARHPSQCPPLRPVFAAGLRSPRSLVLAYNVGRLKARLRAGITARPKGLSGIPAPLGGAVMRRRAGQCWGLCSARCASHRPQQGRRCPSGRHARPPPGQAVQHARRSVPPSPPLLSEWGQGWPLVAPRQQCGRAGAAPPEGSKSGHPAKRYAACGRDGHTGEQLSRVKYTAYGGS